MPCSSLNKHKALFGMVFTTATLAPVPVSFRQNSTRQTVRGCALFQHLGKEGELAATEGGDGTETPPRVRRLRREFLLPFTSRDGLSASTADNAFHDSPVHYRQRDISMSSARPVLDTGDAEVRFRGSREGGGHMGHRYKLYVVIFHRAEADTTFSSTDPHYI